MSGSSSEDESIPPNSESEDQINLGEFFFWAIRFAAIGCAIGFTTGLWSDEEIRLQLMHGCFRLCRSVARMFGAWALQTENAYNQYVESLH